MRTVITGGPVYLSKRLRERMEAAGMPMHVTVATDMAYGPDKSVEIDHREPSPRDDLCDALACTVYGRRYDNPAWPDLSERFTPTMAGLPEPEPERAVWRHPFALAGCLAIYAGLLVGGIWWLSGL